MRINNINAKYCSINRNEYIIITVGEEGAPHLINQKILYKIFVRISLQSSEWVRQPPHPQASVGDPIRGDGRTQFGRGDRYCGTLDII
jgi:hypothetical protein